MQYLELRLSGAWSHTMDWPASDWEGGEASGGWQARVQSRQSHLVLWRSVLSAIPIFYLSVFLLPIGVGKQLEGLMRRFHWRGSRAGKGRGTTIVTWDMV